MQTEPTHDAINFYLIALISKANELPEETDRNADELFCNLLNQFTDQFKIPFNSVFAQSAFLISQLKLESSKAHALHHYRIEFLQNKGKFTIGSHSFKIKFGILSLLNDVLFEKETSDLAEYRIFASRNIRKSKGHNAFFKMIRFSVDEFDPNGLGFKGLSEVDPSDQIHVVLDPNTQPHLIDQLRKDLIYYTCPFEVVLINVKVIKSDYHPEMVILQPDFLLDVTAVAECFSADGASAEEHLLRKLSPKSYSDALFIGLCANYFLDELVFDPEIRFEQLVSGIFRINPLYLASKSNDEVRLLISNIQHHYNNLAIFIKHHQDYSIQSLTDALIEPSYASPKYGIQGRLDVYLNQPEHKTIIELKSGSVFRPNIHGLNQSHYIQTLLYDLLVSGENSVAKSVRSHILYSRQTDRMLRYAPPVRSLQLEALIIRNSIMTIEYRLTMLDANGDDPTKVLDLLYGPQLSGLVGFLGRDAKIIREVQNDLTALQKRYFLAFTGFIAREYFSAKSGFRRSNITTGQSSLWLCNLEEKEDNFAILAFLNISSNQIDNEASVVTLKKSFRTNKLADFRTGDVIVLYKTDESGAFLWDGCQLFKGTVIDNLQDTITVRLRSKQNQTDLFDDQVLWNIEKDTFDSSFANQFKNMVTWASGESRKRDLLLGLIPPEMPNTAYRQVVNDLEFNLDKLIWQILNCRDYFLLWGPPGTGKTSFMIKNIIQLLSKKSPQPILVLAYTNRAVDELCDAIEKINSEDKPSYLRIGSRFGTDPVYQDKLLDQAISQITTRTELLTLLQSTKVYVGTASSISGKNELFNLLQFECAIIDEASQILDPQLLDILMRVERFVMIGDHKQLPAVVTQHPDLTLVTNQELNYAGIEDLSDSMFERLYKRAVAQGWDWAYGLLHKQGRMHEDIMSFPARYFYENQLDIWATNQQERLPQMSKNYVSGSLQEKLSTKRVLFFPVKMLARTGSYKLNNEEAQLIKTIILTLQDLYTKKSLSAKSIGIITPFRNQIVNIKNHLEEIISDFDIVIDTVERFQGGAKDIVIISTVVSQANQLKSIISENKEGIDRKLNVALTRARERLILLGDPDILGQSEFYRAFIDEFSR